MADWKSTATPVAGGTAGGDWRSSSILVNEDEAEIQRYLEFQSKYGDPLSQTAAGAAALGRGLTFGATDYLLTKSGAVAPETLKNLEEANPLTSTGLEIGGALLPIALTGGAAAPGVAAGQVASRGAIKGAARFAPTALADAARVGVAGAVERALPAATSGLINKGIAGGAGSAVEASFYGAGELLSDHALGDPTLNAEKIASRIGYAALTGGALGSILGPIEAKFIAPKKILSETLDQGDTLGAALASDLVGDEQRKGIVAGLKELKPNAKAIQDAAAEIGAPVLESQISSSKHIQDLDSLLTNSPSPIGIARQQQFKQGAEAAQTAVKDVLGNAPPMTQAEAGEAIQGSLSSKIESRYKPISGLYDVLKQSTEHIPVSEKAKNLIEATLKKETQKFSVGIEKKVGDAIINNLPNIKTVDDVKKFNTALYKEFPLNKADVSRFAEKLTDLEEASIVNAAEKFAIESGDETSKKVVLELLGTRKEANRQYKGLIEDISELSQVLGKKKVRGVGDFVDFLQDLTPEKITEKLFTKKNSGFLKKFSTSFPEEASIILSNEKGKLLQKATNGEVFSVNSFGREIDKLSPEIREILFTPQELKKIQAARTYMDSIPKNINPSGTAKATEYEKYFGDLFGSGTAIAGGAATGAAIAGPVGAIAGGLLGAATTQRTLLKDYGIKKLIQATVRGGVENHPELLMQKLSFIERSINKTTNTIEKLSKGIVDVGSKASSYVIPAASILNREEREEKFKKIQEKINETNAPEDYMNKVDGLTSSLYNAAPNISGAMQITFTKATEFLRSKMPRPEVTGPLSPDIEPSIAEINEFLRYADVVENPMIAMEQVISGQLVPQTMETMMEVFPALLQDMRIAVVDKISSEKAKKLPYQTKVMISGFLGEDLVNGIRGESIAANQVSFQGPSGKQDDIQAAQMGKNTSQKGLSGLTLADRSETGTRAVIERKRNS